MNDYEAIDKDHAELCIFAANHPDIAVAFLRKAEERAKDAVLALVNYNRKASGKFDVLDEVISAQKWQKIRLQRQVSVLERIAADNTSQNN